MFVKDAVDEFFKKRRLFSLFKFGLVIISRTGQKKLFLRIHCSVVLKFFSADQQLRTTVLITYKYCKVANFIIATVAYYSHYSQVAWPEGVPPFIVIGFLIAYYCAKNNELFH
ncbi:hypothetical protein CHUAL_012827 [Chamberlinius hualienensis]